MMDERGGRKLQTVETAVEVVEAVQRLDDTRVSKVAEYLELAPSTAHGYLSTLTETRFLVQEGDQYNLGLRFLTMGGHACNNIKGYNYIKQKTKELAETTGERAQFITEENGIGVYVFTITEDSAVEIGARVGKERHLHASAAGKAILAHLPEHRVQTIVEEWGLPEITENTITDFDNLTMELNEVKDDGFSRNNEESVDGLRAVGAPICGAGGEVIGALSVSAPAKRMHGERFTDEVPMDLLGTANEIELHIAHMD